MEHNHSQKLAFLYLLLFSIANFIHYTAFTSFTMQLPIIFQQHGFAYEGQIFLTMNSVCGLFGNLICPAVIHKFGGKKSIVVSSLSYLLSYIFLKALISCHQLSSFCQSHRNVFFLSAIFGAFLGFFNALILLCHFVYVSSLCNGTDNGYKFGIFNAFHHGTNLTAGIISSYIMSRFELDFYFNLLIILTLFGSLMYWLIPFRFTKDQSPNLANGFEQIWDKLARRENMWLCSQLFFQGFYIACYGGSIFRIVSLCMPGVQDYLIRARLAFMYVLAGLTSVSLSPILGKIIDLFDVMLLFNLTNNFSACVLILVLGAFALKNLNVLYAAGTVSYTHLTLPTIYSV
eukprot:TRINITY_DN8965_c0_g1_i2.p1 TRINITY_DN8965_c0_g1~~TRINITY_DN8965_c0_g1_i2.p1  ORF type:complete len:345 (+),score=3.57 TRINITY_DN8965_c0_g1_i2:154-1188(+)